MIAKNKAKELYDKFSEKANSYIEGKRCALLCVEEVLEQALKCNGDYYFWEDVKQELIKL